ncbi:MAG TPA: carboxypeptidase-like regulatory domain-containing protein [Bacteroidia bacterium]|nr:carboxypeptidase-like regulatory domain-containing protein [Bacteroidia bacterium]
MKKIKIIIALLLFSIYSQSFAQFGEIRGKVTATGNGEVLAGATVSYFVNGNLKGVVTDEKGEYKIKPLVAGSYDLRFSFVTFKPYEVKSVAVSSENITYVDALLEPDNDLPEVVIKWEPPMIDPGNASNMTIISSEDIKYSVTRDVVSQVANTAGVVQTEEGGSLNIRGSRDNSTLYIVDGIKMTGPFSVPKSAIQEITVLTGGIPAQYGDATGGIVLITTKSYRKQ